MPKHPSTSTEPLQDTLLDLQAGQIELANGLALVNDRAIPFDVAARDLNAEVHYIATTDRYGATIDLNDLRTKMAKEPEAQSKLHVEAEIGPGHRAADKAGLSYGCGVGSPCVRGSGALCEAQWQGGVEGLLELKQISVLGWRGRLECGDRWS